MLTIGKNSILLVPKGEAHNSSLVHVAKGVIIPPKSKQAVMVEVKRHGLRGQVALSPLATVGTLKNDPGITICDTLVNVRRGRKVQ